MKNYHLYFLIFLSFTACNVSSRKDRDTLVRKTVFVIIDSLENNAALNKTRTIALPKDTSYLEYIFKGYELTDVQALDSTIHVKLSYADTLNFLRINFYDGLCRAYFPCEVAIKLCKAQYYLKEINEDFSLMILDATRPLHIQQLMWDSLKMPADRKFNYLSPPYETSLHNYGCAVDLTIIDASQNKLINMGTDFDFFDKLSQPVYEQKFLKTGELSQDAYYNRRLLRWVMKRAGFSSIASEWWHFACYNKEQAAAKFKLIK